MLLSRQHGRDGSSAVAREGGATASKAAAAKQAPGAKLLEELRKKGQTPSDKMVDMAKWLDSMDGDESQVGCHAA